jgi:AcrR family transcriptional regulator
VETKGEKGRRAKAKKSPRKKAPAQEAPRSLRAADARERILEVAGAMLADVGPDGLRLEKIAHEVGVSHPAILHHFGSRAGLVHAVVERAVVTMETDVIKALSEAASAHDVDPIAPIERAFSVLYTEGHARLLAWLALSGMEDTAKASKIGEIARAVHAIRESRFAERGLACPPFEDTSFVVLLAAFALFGEAICGGPMRQATEMGKQDHDGTRFRRWMAHLFYEHLEAPKDGKNPSNAKKT